MPTGEQRSGHTEMLRRRLTEARTAEGLTQRDVAKRVSERLGRPVGDTTISNWETMTRQPGIDEFASWSRAVGYQLKVDLEPLGSNRIQVMVNRDRAETLKAIDVLSPEQFAAIAAVVDEFGKLSPPE